MPVIGGDKRCKIPNLRIAYITVFVKRPDLCHCKGALSGAMAKGAKRFLFQGKWAL